MNICLNWGDNLFLNFQKFEKFENEKMCPKIMFFLFLFPQTLDSFKSSKTLQKAPTIRKSLILSLKRKNSSNKWKYQK